MVRRFDIDILKGIAIIAVILYHVGILPYGYLGVDMFLVISGFLIIPSLIKDISDGSFSYFAWLWKRIKRFLPLVIAVCAVSLIIGYFTMMPDDYENLAQSSFASEIFCNNILQAITTGNYWDSSSEYKPLLALWYLGVVVQFFIIFPIILLTIKAITSKKINKHRLLVDTTICLAIVSFALYLLLPINYNYKFYYIPFRIWEFCVGGIIFYVSQKSIRISRVVYYIFLILLTLILCIGFKSLSQLDLITIVGISDENLPTLFSKELFLVSIVVLTGISLLTKFNTRRGGRLLAIIGEMSFSLFIWHQLILAFLRYSITESITLPIFLIYLIATGVISYASFYYLENIKLKTLRTLIPTITCWVVVLCTSYYIYYRAGVMRDIPEMGVTYENPYDVRNTEYIDRIYSLDKPFSTDKTKVLVIGNSFARDFACCLDEWEGSENLEISYMYKPKDNDNRYAAADYIFIFGSKDKVPSYIWDVVNDSFHVYGIGTKSFGKSFGNVYAKRNSSDYYKASVQVPAKLAIANDEWHKAWGDNYIDFLNASLNENGEIRLFTPDSMIISFDCRHLSPAGAKFFSKRFDFDKIFNSNQ